LKIIFITAKKESILIRARIIDYNNDGVENAPVTFSIENGAGSFPGNTAVTTNSEGWAVVTFNYPADFGTTQLKQLLPAIFREQLIW
jgi:hypothetical protein